MSSLNFKDSEDKDLLASTVVYQYEKWQGFKDTAMSQWEEIEAYLYATDTTSLNDAFDHTTHIPVLAEIKEDLEAIMYSTILPHQDWLGWRPDDFEAATIDKRDKALAYINNRHNLNGFRRTVRKLVHDFITYGNAIVMTVHVDERPVAPDGTRGSGYYGPKPRRISPYDFVFDPTVEDFKDSPKIVRETISIGEFLKRAEQYQWRTEAIQRVLERRSATTELSSTDTHKDKQYVPDGFNSYEAYMSSGKVDILWYYGDIFDESTKELKEKRCVGVVDREDLLFDEYNPRDTFRLAGWGLRPDNLWSQSPLAKIVGINYQIDHRENAKSTAIDKFIYPDRILSGDVEEVYDDVTGQTRYIASEGGNVSDISPDASVLQFDTQIDRLTAQARNAARLPQQLSGFKTAGEKTLGEVQMLNEGAFRGFIHKAEQFELDLLEPMISDEIELGATYFDELLVAPMDSDEGIQYIDITQDDLRSNGKLIPYGARRFARDLQQLSTLQQLGNSNLMQLMAQHIVPFKLAQTIERLGGFKKFEFIEKFGALEEQSEQQNFQNAQETVQQDRLENPSLQEAQLGGLLGGQDDNTSISQ